MRHRMEALLSKPRHKKQNTKPLPDGIQGYGIRSRQPGTLERRQWQPGTHRLHYLVTLVQGWAETKACVTQPCILYRRPYINKEQSAIFNLHNSVGSMIFNTPILCIFNTPILCSFTQFHAKEPFQV